MGYQRPAMIWDTFTGNNVVLDIFVFLVLIQLFDALVVPKLRINLCWTMDIPVPRRPGSNYRVPNTKYLCQVPSTNYKIPITKYQIPVPRSPGSMYQIPITKYQMPTTCAKVAWFEIDVSLSQLPSGSFSKTLARQRGSKTLSCNHYLGLDLFCLSA